MAIEVDIFLLRRLHEFENKSSKAIEDVLMNMELIAKRARGKVVASSSITP